MPTRRGRGARFEPLAGNLHPYRPDGVPVIGAEVFDDAAFVGLARAAKRDPYRLSLFAQHLGPGERPRVVLPIQGGTLIVTDERLLELQPHLEVHGAWNVKEFQGYAIHRALPRNRVRDVAHELQPSSDPPSGRRTEDRIRLTTDDGMMEFLVSRAPEPTLSDADFETLRRAILATHRM